MRFSWFVLAIVVLTVVTRLPILLHPQSVINEAIYSVVANEIVDGGRPYVDALERKPPLLFWTYAAIFKFFGKYNWRALHLVSLLWTLATMAGLFVIGRELFNRDTGLVAALLYSIFQPWLRGQNLAFNGELMMNLPIVLAYAIAFRKGESRLRPELFFAGILLCAAFLLKQPAAIAAVPLGIYLLLPSYRTARGLTNGRSIAHAALLTAGFFATLIAVAVILNTEGILREAFDGTFTDNALPHFFYTKGFVQTLWFTLACLPIVLGAMVSLRSRELWSDKKPERWAIILLLVGSAIGAAAGGRFYVHYYIQLIPPLALLSAPVLVFWLRKRTVIAWLAVTVVVFSVVQWRELSSLRAPTEAGRYLAEHSSPNDRVFVWGQSAKIYLEARRRPASRFVEAAPLTGHVFGGVLPGVDTHRWVVPGSWNALKEDFAKHPPGFIVDDHVDTAQPHPIADYPILAHLLANEYEPVAHVTEGVIYRRKDF